MLAQINITGKSSAALGKSPPKMQHRQKNIGNYFVEIKKKVSEENAVRNPSGLTHEARQFLNIAKQVLQDVEAEQKSDLDLYTKIAENISEKNSRKNLNNLSHTAQRFLQIVRQSLLGPLH
jgi:hypothetical protein